MSSKNILVAFGGMSPEHEVSVLSAMQVISSLEGTGYRVLPLYVTKGGRWLTGERLLDLEEYQDLEGLTGNAVPCTFSHDGMGRAVLQETRRRGLSRGRNTIPFTPLSPHFTVRKAKTGGSREPARCTMSPMRGAAYSPPR